MNTDKEACVVLYLAGAFLFIVDEKPIQKYHSNKTRALLAYLILEGNNKPLKRDEIVNVLWHGYTQKSGRASLRVALSNLRQILGSSSDLIIGKRHTIQFNSRDPKFWCDVLHLQQMAQQPPVKYFDTTSKNFYRSLLSSFQVVDSPPYGEWLAKQQAAYSSLLNDLHKKQAAIRQSKHNLPRLLTPLFGRSAEINELVTYVTHPDITLTTVTGPSGVGKTSVAIACAQQIKEQFVDGAWFIPLDRLTMVAESAYIEQVACAICSTLDFIPAETLPISQQLVEHLNQKELLLILDNVEHVDAITPFLLQLLANTNAVTLLVTTYQRLNVLSEQCFPLKGLAVPQGDERDVASVLLFEDRLRRINKSAEFSPHSWSAVGSICRRLNGLPLGIELAAIACQETLPELLLTSMQVKMDIFQTNMRSFATRHSNLWTVIEQSWKQLTSQERRVLLQCTVFDGGFSAETLKEITQTDTLIIEKLTRYMLLTPTANNELTMHPQLYRHCQRVSAESPALKGWVHQAKQRHAMHYLSLLTTQNSDSEDNSIQLCKQLNNIEYAWQWAIKHAAHDILYETIPTLTQLFSLANLKQTGVLWLEYAQESSLPHQLKTMISDAIVLLSSTKTATENHAVLF